MRQRTVYPLADMVAVKIVGAPGKMSKAKVVKIH